MGKLAFIGERAGGYLYFLFRVFVGMLFLQHGAQKLFGWGGAAAAGTLMFIAGVVELVGGLAILIGFFTRIAALLGGLQMIVAFFMVHVKDGINPFTNGGELAVLFLGSFLILLAYGAQKWSLERKLLGKEMF